MGRGGGNAGIVLASAVAEVIRNGGRKQRWTFKRIYTICVVILNFYRLTEPSSFRGDLLSGIHVCHGEKCMISGKNISETVLND